MSRLHHTVSEQLELEDSLRRLILDLVADGLLFLVVADFAFLVDNELVTLELLDVRYVLVLVEQLRQFVPDLREVL